MGLRHSSLSFRSAARNLLFSPDADTVNFSRERTALGMVPFVLVVLAVRAVLSARYVAKFRKAQ